MFEPLTHSLHNVNVAKMLAEITFEFNQIVQEMNESY